VRGCDTCFYFIRIKDWVGRVGICDYEDGSLSKVIKQCENYKSKKYKKENQTNEQG
jgi:hypothetical protein